LIGNRDIATHLMRTHRLREGKTLTEITADLCAHYGVRVPIFPMANMPHLTFIRDRAGKMHSFQDWLMKLRAEPLVDQVVLMGDTHAANGVRETHQNADLVILPPSNRFVTTDASVRVHDLRENLQHTRVIGVSPIIGTAAVPRPLAAMIASLPNLPPTPRAIAEYYADFLDILVIPPQDRWPESP